MASDPPPTSGHPAPAAAPARQTDTDTLNTTEMLEAIDRKRTQLDRQIAEFRSLKTQEFRAYEYWVRHTARKSDLEKEKQRSAYDGMLRTPEDSPARRDFLHFEPRWPADREAAMAEREQIDPAMTTAFYGEEGCRALSELSKKRKEDKEKEQEQQEHGRSSSPPRSPDSIHEREREFAGIITPGYLPLLDGRIADDDHDDGCAHQTKVKSLGLENEDLDLALRDDPNASFSSTATVTNGDHRPSPLTSHPYSNGDDANLGTPDRPTHRRSSSARSSASLASLRSSLKDPNAPRSPKRVMFEIDNSVVSPSTSPLFERGRRGTPSGKGKKVTEDGESFEIVRKKRSGSGHGSSSSSHKRLEIKQRAQAVAAAAEAAQHQQQQMDQDVDMASQSTLISTQEPQQPFAIASQISTGTNASMQSTPTLVDDFEDVTFGDDMFAFDEDLEMGDADDDHHGIDSNDGESHRGRKGHPNRERDGGAMDNEEEEDGLVAAAAAASSSSSVTGSSPHAGSLPIEIKWPGRRGGGMMDM